MKNLFRFMRHIDRVRGAAGARRAAYAVWHIFVIALAVAFAFGTYWLLSNIEDIFSGNFVVGIFAVIGICVCAASALICVLQGFVAQIATIVAAAVGLKNSEGRSGNVAAIVISAVGFVLMVAAVAVLIFLLS